MPPDLTIIIPTRGRPDSLSETLQCLAVANQGDIAVETLVVDNLGQEEVRQVCQCYETELPVVCLLEERAGKGHALNRALQHQPLGDLVAVLDDDMSVDPGWIQGVMAIAARWPDHGFFTGRSQVVWPEGVTVPAWSELATIRSWAFSVMGEGLKADRVVAAGSWASGNHFWFRRAALDHVSTFEPIWLCEPTFMLCLQAAGLYGVIGPDALVGHRIQPGLLNLEAAKARASRVGTEFSRLRVRFSSTRAGRLYRRSRFLFLLAAVAGVMRWSLACAIATFRREPGERISRQLQARERLAAYREHVRSSFRKIEQVG